MIGGLGDEVPRSKNFLVIKYFSYSSSFCEFHYSKNLSVIVITKCEKKIDHCLGGPWPPVAPLDPPLHEGDKRLNEHRGRSSNQGREAPEN